MQAKNPISRKQVHSDFNSVIPEISNLLKAEACKFPKWMGYDHDDMVQEALIRIWEKRKNWDPDKGAGIKRWSLIVARNEYRYAYGKEKRRTESRDKNKIALPMSTIEQPDSNIAFEKLVRTISNRLKGKTKLVFDAMVEQPEGLRQLAIENYNRKKEQLRNGERKNDVIELMYTQQDLADYLGIESRDVSSAKNKIRKVIDKVMM